MVLLPLTNTAWNIDWTLLFINQYLSLPARIPENISLKPIKAKFLYLPAPPVSPSIFKCQFSSRGSSFSFLMLLHIFVKISLQFELFTVDYIALTIGNGEIADQEMRKMTTDEALPFLPNIYLS